jgi:hypothetical protein
VVSSKIFSSGERAIRLVERELNNRGLEINLKKKKESGFQNKNRVRLVHNICVNKRGTQVCKAHQQEITQLAESYVASCKSVQPATIELGPSTKTEPVLSGKAEPVGLARVMGTSRRARVAPLGTRVEARSQGWPGVVA